MTKSVNIAVFKNFIGLGERMTIDLKINVNGGCDYLYHRFESDLDFSSYDPFPTWDISNIYVQGLYDLVRQAERKGFSGLVSKLEKMIKTEVKDQNGDEYGSCTFTRVFGEICRLNQIPIKF